MQPMPPEPVRGVKRSVPPPSLPLISSALRVYF